MHDYDAKYGPGLDDYGRKNTALAEEGELQLENAALRTRAEKAEAERDKAIKTIGEEGRLRGLAEAYNERLGKVMSGMMGNKELNVYINGIEDLEAELAQANEKEEIASRAYAEAHAYNVKLKKAARNLLKWHDEELPKWTGFINMNLIRKDMTTVEGAKDCEAEVRALRKALNENEDEKEIEK